MTVFTGIATVTAVVVVALPVDALVITKQFIVGAFTRTRDTFLLFGTGHVALAAMFFILGRIHALSIA
jgi:hypothetical protein